MSVPAIRRAASSMVLEKVAAEVRLGRLLGLSHILNTWLTYFARHSHQEKEARKVTANSQIATCHRHRAYRRMTSFLLRKISCLLSCGRCCQLCSEARSERTLSDKVGLVDAFRIFLVRKENWRYYDLRWKTVIAYCLPISCGTPCVMFQSLTRAICRLAEKEMPGSRVYGYMDNFLICIPSKNMAYRDMAVFLALGSDRRVAFSPKKMVDPIQSLVFLD